MFTSKKRTKRSIRKVVSVSWKLPKLEKILKKLSAYCLKQIDSMSASVCSGIDHRILLYVVELLMFSEPPRFLRNYFIHVKICC